MDAEFSVPARDLEEGTREYVFPIRPEWLATVLAEGEVKATTEEGGLTARLSKIGKDVVVQGHVKTAVEVPCARCLKPCRAPIEVDWTALMVPSAGVLEDGSEEAEAADLVPYDGQTVVLDDLVRDEILLGIPMIPLCSEDCPGMSTGPRKEEVPLDPRLEPLRRIKLSKE